MRFHAVHLTDVYRPELGLSNRQCISPLAALLPSNDTKESGRKKEKRSKKKKESRSRLVLILAFIVQFSCWDRPAVTSLCRTSQSYNTVTCQVLRGPCCAFCSCASFRPSALSSLICVCVCRCVRTGKMDSDNSSCCSPL